MSTGIGACLVCLTPSLNRSLLACTLSFSAGVMIYVSLVEASSGDVIHSYSVPITLIPG